MTVSIEPKLMSATGHVTEECFRAVLESHSIKVPPDAKIEHVFIRSVRVANDDWGNRQSEVRHFATGRPMTYWEIAPNRGAQ